MEPAHIGDVIRDTSRPELGELTVNDYRCNLADFDHMTAYLHCRTADGRFLFVNNTHVEMMRVWVNPFRPGDAVAWGTNPDKPGHRPYKSTLTEIWGHLGRGVGSGWFGLETAQLLHRPEPDEPHQLALPLVMPWA